MPQNDRESFNRIQMERQLENWRDSFINTSIKNNKMLNLNPKICDSVIFDVNQFYTYEQFWRIATSQNASKKSEYALKHFGNPNPGTNPISWHSALTSKMDVDLMHSIVRDGVEAIVQKGQNPICLMFGKLKWYIACKDDKEEEYGEIFKKQIDGESNKFVYIETPLILIPVKINERGTNFWMKPVDEEAMINPALLLKFKSEGYEDFPLPECGQWIDGDNFDIVSYFDNLESYFKNGDFKFEKNYVGLNTFDYDRMCMYKDVHSHFEELKNNKIIRAFFGESLNTPAKIKGINHLDPSKSFCVLDTDTSQNNVIERFNNDESFILEGPPGTGKTQTIINIIAEAIQHNKSVLFVSGKMSALNTVIKKLKQFNSVNIDKHCILITGEDESGKNNITDTYGKLNAAYNAPCPEFKASDYVRNAETLVNARDTLVAYNKEFYDTNNSLQMSPYDLIGRMLVLGYNENFIIPVHFNEDFLVNLTHSELIASAKKIGDIQSVLTDILKRSKNIENDVWYGYKNFSVETSDADKLRSYCSSVKSAIERVADVFDSVKSDGNTHSKEVFELLSGLPLSTICVIIDDNLKKALNNLYISNNFDRARQIICNELKLSASYLPAAKALYAIEDGECTEDIAQIESRLKGAERFEGLTISQLNEELSNLNQFNGKSQFVPENSALNDPLISVKQLHDIIGTIDKIVKDSKLTDDIKKEISEFFGEDILDYDYKPLLMKFRTSWESNVKNRKAPLFFESHIKELKKRCKNIQLADFSIVSVYKLLEQLDLIKSGNEAIKNNRAKLSDYCIQDFSISSLAAISAALTEFVNLKEAGEISVAENASGYITERQNKYRDIINAAKALKLKGNPSVKDVRHAAKLYRTISNENNRIKNSAELSEVLPNFNKNVLTDWRNVIDAINTVERIRSTIHDENRSWQEEFALFAETIDAFVSHDIYGAVENLNNIYNKFYGDDEWFDVNSDKFAHSSDGMSLSDYGYWLEQIGDINHLASYVAYKNSVQNIQGTPEGEFFSVYANEGRKKYPIDKMRDNYEVSLLYAYYNNLIKDKKNILALSGSDGITTIKRVTDIYADADKKALEFNRKLVDLTLYKKIERTAIGGSPTHGYLRSINTDKNTSVRKLFKFREKSIKQLAPCLMMSVYAVSKLLEYENYQFDVVIFDEASQIPAEDALTSLMRAKRQVIISGDPKQMPAISYFGKRTSNVGSSDPDDEDAPQTCTSIIDFVISAPNNTLGYEHLDMHYRSNHESLIKFSNEYEKLYGGNLVTFPSPKSREEDFGLWDYSLSEDPRYCNSLSGGKGENKTEAEVVIELIRSHFRKYPIPNTPEEREKFNSLGIIVFGTRQKNLIFSKLRQDEELKKVATINDPSIFSITTADEIQGDEMSEMILSLTYGRGPDGKISSAWGHMNQLPVALYKFNVAVTRAKNNLKFVHSVTSGDLANSKNLEYVADYLRQFGSAPECQFNSDYSANTDFITAIGKICEEVVGKERVKYNFGESLRSYRVPISILSVDKKRVVLGILCEKDRSFSADREFSVREYSRTCNDILRAHGWDNMYETYAIQWLRNYSVEKVELLNRLKIIKDL